MKPGPWVAVLLVLLGAALIRFRLLETPLERDEGEYAYAGQLMLEGIPPYQLAYNMKLPGTYAAYALLMAAFERYTALRTSCCENSLGPALPAWSGDVIWAKAEVL